MEKVFVFFGKLQFRIISKKKYIMKCFDKNNYYIDENKEVDIVYKNSTLLVTKQSKFQKIQVYDNNFFGRILVIDDDLKIRSFEREI